MKNDLVSISGKFLPRRMVLQGIASLFGGALAPGAFAATENNCQLTESDILGPFYRFGAPFQTKLAGPDVAFGVSSSFYATNPGKGSHRGPSGVADVGFEPT